jgi:hypothetical protein
MKTERNNKGAKVILLNPKREPLTKEKYRQLSGLQHLSDEEAEQATLDIQKLAKILYLSVNQKKAI